MLRTAAGAPLRAMASLAAIWILLRVVLSNSPANIAWKPVDSVISNTENDDKKRKRQAQLVSSLTMPKKSRQDGGAKRRDLSLVTAKRGAGVSPTAEWPVSRMPILSRLLWQDSDDVRSFFLQTSFTGSGADLINEPRSIQRFPNPPTKHQSNRMGAYLWIYARQDFQDKQGGHAKGGRFIPNGQYGGSQAGAILSYRIFDGPLPEISLYGRLSAALAPWSEKEVALGTRIRPVRSLPVAFHAEQRFDVSSGEDSGTAFYVTGGTGPDQIVEKFALETYAQAGYVLGRNETYFFDGSATLQRQIAELGSTKLFFGPGAWAGGQRQISRMDVGPRVDLRVPIGAIPARIAVDWRLRVVGNARPGSGAAITVSTGF